MATYDPRIGADRMSGRGGSHHIKWSFPNFLHHGLLCNMAAFKAHCTFGFWKASLLGVGGKAGAMGQFGRITSVKDLPPKRDLVRLVRQAAAPGPGTSYTPGRTLPFRQRPLQIVTPA